MQGSRREIATAISSQNRSTESDAIIMEIGTRVEGDEAFYPDIDLRTVDGQGYAHRDGTLYPKEKRRS